MSELEESRTSLQRMQAFNPEDLAREDDLGRQLNFRDAVGPAQKLIDLYLQLSLETLTELPVKQLTDIKNIADADFNRFNDVLKFEIAGDNATGRRDTLLEQISSSYQGTFNTLHPMISYGMTRAVDFQRMENEARATIQSIEDQASEVTKALEESRKQATSILEEIRKVAAEQGVSQQASYFKEEAEKHEGLADTWRKRTIYVAIGLGAYAVLALFLHKIPFMTPTDVYQSIQLVTGKILVFAVIGYMVILSARNFLSHEHNTIINKHRQNALMTYKALVDAAQDEEVSDIVLLHAAQCIFSPQETGYAKQEGARGGPMPVLELLRRSGLKADGQ